MGLFSGRLSHAVIFFNTKEGAQKTGVNAIMKLCFGKDEDAISQIVYCTSLGSKTPVWALPTMQSNKPDIIRPVFTGAVGEEILDAVGTYAGYFKQYYKAADGAKVGRAWRISKNGIQEITQEKTSSKS